MATLYANIVFTNTALTPEGDVWWEGMTPEPPPHLTDWHGEDWTPASGRTAAHPNARFTAPAAQCPSIAPEWEDPAGVPISAILFGGRRTSTVPLVYEARTWEHGVFVGATMASETTAASAGAVGQLRRDPFAMMPFCGYHMGDYFGHWLATGAAGDASKLPRIFQVNWFRKDEDGRFLWPGYGENSRVLAWIAERCEGTADAVESPIGLLPAHASLHVESLGLSDAALEALFTVDVAGWTAELSGMAAYFASFGDRLPPELLAQLDDLRARLAATDS